MCRWDSFRWELILHVFVSHRFIGILQKLLSFSFLPLCLKEPNNPSPQKTNTCSSTHLPPSDLITLFRVEDAFFQSPPVRGGRENQRNGSNFHKLWRNFRLVLVMKHCRAACFPLLIMVGFTCCTVWTLFVVVVLHLLSILCCVKISS